MTIHEERHGTLLVLKPEGKLDSTHAPGLESAILEALQGGGESLLVDMSDVTYISSRGLRVFLLGAKKAKAGGGRIAVCALQDFVREVFQLSGFLALLEVFESAEEALESFRHGSEETDRDADPG